MLMVLGEDKHVHMPLQASPSTLAQLQLPAAYCRTLELPQQ